MCWNIRHAFSDIAETIVLGHLCAFDPLTAIVNAVEGAESELLIRRPTPFLDVP